VVLATRIIDKKMQQKYIFLQLTTWGYGAHWWMGIEFLFDQTFHHQFDSLQPYLGVHERRAWINQLH
jgi:hypothetical protein